MRGDYRPDLAELPDNEEAGPRLAQAPGSPSSFDVEMFCGNCKKVFRGGHGKCCGHVVVFNLEDQRDVLISGSNAWQTVWGKWKDHPMVRKTAKELAKRGNYSAAGILNAAFSKMANSH